MFRMNGEKQYYSTNGIKYIDILFQKRYNLYIEVITMQIREASEKWNISERRIRQLIQDGRIEGAEKIGTTWNIPDDTNKPIDKRVKDEIEFKIDLPEDYFNEVDEKLAKLNSKRPLPKEATESLQNAINLEWTYNSNGTTGIAVKS